MTSRATRRLKQWDQAGVVLPYTLVLARRRFSSCGSMPAARPNTGPSLYGRAGNSNAVDGWNFADGDCVGEPLVIEFVLICVRSGEVGDRLVKPRSRAQVRGDCEPVA